MRDSFHEEARPDVGPARRDDPAGRLGDDPRHHGPARRRPAHRRERDRRRRGDRPHPARGSTTAPSTCSPCSSRSPPTCASSSPACG
nr:hypothetical protein [Angustibacter aerolatus]